MFSSNHVHTGQRERLRDWVYGKKIHLKV